MISKTHAERVFSHSDDVDNGEEKSPSQCIEKREEEEEKRRDDSWRFKRRKKTVKGGLFSSVVRLGSSGE